MPLLTVTVPGIEAAGIACWRLTVPAPDRATLMPPVMVLARFRVAPDRVQSSSSLPEEVVSEPPVIEALAWVSTPPLSTVSV